MYIPFLRLFRLFPALRALLYSYSTPAGSGFLIPYHLVYSARMQPHALKCASVGCTLIPPPLIHPSFSSSEEGSTSPFSSFISHDISCCKSSEKSCSISVVVIRRGCPLPPRRLAVYRGRKLTRLIEASALSVVEAAYAGFSPFPS